MGERLDSRPFNPELHISQTTSNNGFAASQEASPRSSLWQKPMSALPQCLLPAPAILISPVEATAQHQARLLIPSTQQPKSRPHNLQSALIRSLGLAHATEISPQRRQAETASGSNGITIPVFYINTPTTRV